MATVNNSSAHKEDAMPIVYEAHVAMPCQTGKSKRQSRPTAKYEAMRQERQKDVDVGRKPAKLCQLASELMASMPSPLPQPIPSPRNFCGYYGVCATTNSFAAMHDKTSYQVRVKYGAGVLYLGTFGSAYEAGRIAAGACAQLEEALVPTLSMKWTTEEDDKLCRVVTLAAFGNARGTRGCDARTTPQFWTHVAKAMGFGDSLKSSRRCGRRWWRIDPRNKQAVDDAREKSTRRRHARMAEQRETVAEDDFAALLNVQVPMDTLLDDLLPKDPVVVVHAEPVVVVDAEPVVPDLHAHESLSDATSEAMSDVASDVSDATDLSDVDDVDDGCIGGFFPRIVKCVPKNQASHQALRYHFKTTNLGSCYKFEKTNFYNLTRKQRAKSSSVAAKRPHHHHHHPGAPVVVVAKAVPSMPQPQPALLPERLPQFEDSQPKSPLLSPAFQAPMTAASLAPPLVQEHIDHYLKICKAVTSAATTRETKAALAAKAAEAARAVAVMRLLDFEQFATLRCHN